MIDKSRKLYDINEEIERSIQSMCNLSEVIREEGIEIGRGTYVGLEEGLN